MGFEGFWSGQAGKTEVKYDGVYMREITESQLRYISGAGGAPATSANAAGAAAIVGGSRRNTWWSTWGCSWSRICRFDNSNWLDRGKW